MKKRFFAALVACCFAVVLAFTAGCAGETDESWLVSEAANETVYGYASGTEWVFEPLTLSQAYNDLPVMSYVRRVGKGRFRWTVNASISDNSPLDWMGGVLRVIDDEENELVAMLEVKRTDFLKPNEVQALTLDFQNDSSRDLRFEIVVLNNATWTFDACRLQSIDASEAEVIDPSGFIAPGSENVGKARDGVLYYFDLAEWMTKIPVSEFAYDGALFVTALQGLVNRDAPRLFVRFTSGTHYQQNMDDSWLERVVVGEGAAYEGTEVSEVKHYGDIITLFGDEISGLTYWDSSVPATENVACTVCGVEGYLPVRYSESETSFCAALKSYFPELEQKLDLMGKFKDGIAGASIWDCAEKSTGSAKCDAYLWAKEKYLDTGKTNPTLMAFHLDAFTWDKTQIAINYYDLQGLFLANKDYYIADKAFFWDLSVWDTVRPNDDMQQPLGSDYRTLCSILESQNHQAAGEIIEIGGFAPWYAKYSSQAGYGNEGQPKPEQTEFQTSKVFGTYYGIKDADAWGLVSLANASIYCRLPLRESLQQPNRAEMDRTDEEMLDYCREMGYIDEDGNVVPNNYVLVYMGDFDSSAWLMMTMPAFMEDEALGFIPMSYPVNAGPSRRAGIIFEYMYDTVAERGLKNVYFVGDHNGYGYLEIGMLTASDRPAELNGSLDSYLEEAQAFNKKYDLSHQAFLINTTGTVADAYPYSPEIMAKLSAASPGGLCVNSQAIQSFVQGTINVKSGELEVPWTKSVSVPGDATAATTANVLLREFGAVGAKPTFTQLRTVLMYPSMLRDAWQQAESGGASMVPLDPYTYFALAKFYNRQTGNILAV